jgi:hypothetical protein
MRREMFRLKPTFRPMPSSVHYAIRPLETSNAAQRIDERARREDARRLAFPGAELRALAPGAALFLLAFTVTAVLLTELVRAIAPLPFMGVLSDKLAHYQSLEHVPDVVLVGTSRVFLGIDPEVVEAEAGRERCDLNVYNFGVPGGNIAHITWITERILTDPRGRPRWLFVEEALRPYRPHGGMPTAAYDVYFTQLRYLPLYIAHTMTDPSGLWGRSRRLFWLGVSYAYIYSGIGTVHRALMGDAGGAVTYDSAFLTRSGFQPADKETLNPERLAAFRAIRQQMTLERSRAEVQNRPIQPSPPANRHLIERELERIAETNVGAGFFVPPTLSAYDPELRRAVALGGSADAVIDLNSAASYPTLFEPRLWFDHHHLTSEGARLASRLFGERLCAVVSASGQR